VSDFFDDALVLRQVQRAKEQEARDNEYEEGEEEFDDDGPRSIQRTRAVDLDAESARKARVKRERQSHGDSSMLSRNPQAESTEPEEMDEDED
jgi:hypothetical protein